MPIDKLRDTDTFSEQQQFLIDNPDIQFVDGIMVDLCGVVRGKRYPRADIEKLYSGALALPFTVFLMDVTGDNSDPCGRGFADGDPDGVCLPVENTLVRIPWADDPRAQVLVTMYENDGSPSLIDPRNVAKRVMARFSEIGLTPVIAFELEFYLIDKERRVGGGPQAPISPLTGQRETSTQVYGIDELDGFGRFFKEVNEAARIQKIPATVASSEFAPGQYEINLAHVDDAVVAADHCALLRNLVRRTAKRYGMEATFMAKPYAQLSGSGMHLHISLVNEQGENVFASEDPHGSPELHHAIGGMMTSMFEASAIFAPHLNALRRYQPNIYVPVSKSWGVNNRSVAFRIPLSDSHNRRIEHRVASADANPYLVLATVLASVHRGLIEKIDPGAPSTDNACDKVDHQLPRDWRSSIELTRGCALLREYMTDEVVELYCETKLGEMEAFHETVSPQEYAWYL